MIERTIQGQEMRDLQKKGEARFIDFAGVPGYIAQYNNHYYVWYDLFDKYEVLNNATRENLKDV